MMQWRRLIGAVLFWLVGAVAPAYAEQAYPESIGTGEVVEVDVAARTIIIEGYRYGYEPGLPVQIGGSTSDVSLLLPGMKVQFRFLRLPGGLREVIEVRQIPPGVEIYRL